MQGSLAERLRVLRARQGLSLTEASKRAGITRDTLSDLERAKRHAHMPTLAKLPHAYGVPVEDLLEEPVPLAEASQETGRLQDERSLELEAPERPPLGPASPSQQPTLNKALEEERRARWDAVVREARQLRKPGWTQMQRALDAWRESKDRGEPYAARREHLDKMGTLLQNAYGAYLALGN